MAVNGHQNAKPLHCVPPPTPSTYLSNTHFKAIFKVIKMKLRIHTLLTKKSFDAASLEGICTVHYLVLVHKCFMWRKRREFDRS